MFNFRWHRILPENNDRNEKETGITPKLRRKTELSLRRSWCLTRMLRSVRDNRRSTSRAKITGSPMTDTATWHTRPKAAKDSAKLRPTGRMKMRALRKSTPIQQSGLPHTHTLTGYNTSWTETTATSWKAQAKRAARESGRGRDRELKARGETGIFCGICIQLTIATIVIVIAIPMACQLQLTLRLNGPPNGFCPLPTGTSHQIPWNSESPLEC